MAQDVVSVVGTGAVVRIEGIKVFHQLQDQMVWIDVKPLQVLDEDEWLLAGGFHSLSFYLTRFCHTGFHTLRLA